MRLRTALGLSVDLDEESGRQVIDDKLVMSGNLQVSRVGNVLHLAGLDQLPMN